MVRRRGGGHASGVPTAAGRRNRVPWQSRLLVESHEAELIACAERRALARAARQRNHRPGRVGVALARLLVTMAARTPVSCTVGAPR